MKNKKKKSSGQSLNALNLFMPDKGGKTAINAFNNATGDATGVGCSTTGGTSAAATGGMGESLELDERLDRLKLEELRQYIAQVCNLPSASILLYDNGRFHIYNVPEREADSIKRKLLQDTKILLVFSSGGSYDFSHFNQMMLPTLKLNISGIIEESIITEDDGPELLNYRSNNGGIDNNSIAKAPKLDVGLKDIGSTIKLDITSRFNEFKDVLYLKDAVERYIINSFRTKQPVLFIYDGTGHFSTENLVEWIRYFAGKRLHIYSNLHQLCGTNLDPATSTAVLDKFLKSTNTTFGVGNNRATVHDFDELYNKFCTDYQTIKSALGKNPNAQNASATQIGQTTLSNFYPTAGKGTVDDLIMLNLCAKYKLEHPLEADAVNAMSQILATSSASLAKNDLYAGLTQVYNSFRKDEKNTNEGTLSNLVLEDIKHKTRFTIILSPAEYKTISSKPGGQVLQQCLIVDLHKDPESIKKDLEKTPAGLIKIAGKDSTNANTTNTTTLSTTNSTTNNNSNNLVKSLYDSVDLTSLNPQSRSLANRVSRNLGSNSGVDFVSENWNTSIFSKLKDIDD